MDFQSRLDKVFDLLKKQGEERRAKKLQKQQAARLTDLYATVHRVGKVVLPLPSVFALDWLNNWFGDLSKVDFSQHQAVFAVVWICENQKDVARVTAMTREETELAISERMAQVNGIDFLWYVQAVDDIFEFVKKNYLQDQREILEATLELVISSQVSAGNA